MTLRALGFRGSLRVLGGLHASLYKLIVGNDGPPMNTYMQLITLREGLESCRRIAFFQDR